jgi:poly(A) polymerase
VEDTGTLEEVAALTRLHRIAGEWKRPRFPVRGADLIKAGAEPGPQMGEMLARLEQEWIESGFRLDRHALLARAAEMLK